MRGREQFDLGCQLGKPAANVRSLRRRKPTKFARLAPPSREGVGARLTSPQRSAQVLARPSPFYGTPPQRNTSPWTVPPMNFYGPKTAPQQSPNRSKNGALPPSQDVTKMRGGDATRSRLRTMPEELAGVISRGLKLQTHAIRGFLFPPHIPTTGLVRGYLRITPAIHQGPKLPNSLTPRGLPLDGRPKIRLPLKVTRPQRSVPEINAQRAPLFQGAQGYQLQLRGPQSRATRRLNQTVLQIRAMVTLRPREGSHILQPIDRSPT